MIQQDLAGMLSTVVMSIDMIGSWTLAELPVGSASTLSMV